MVPTSLEYICTNLLPKKALSQTHLNTSSQGFVQDMSPSLHELDIKRRRVRTLAIHNRIYKTVAELLARSQQVGFYKVHHAVI